MWISRMRLTRAALLVVTVVALFWASSASALLLGEFTRFQHCPRANAEVQKCLYMVGEGGSLTLGSRIIPIDNSIAFQGGIGSPSSGISQFYGATGGATLSKTPQPMPGGLAGLVPPETAPWLVASLEAFFVENMLTGVSATLELAGSESSIEVGELHLYEAEGIALKLPVKVHLENPFLGKACYIGSSSTPLVWELTTGTTSPEEPNEPISGTPGTTELLEEEEIREQDGVELVDNKWAAPKAHGCGGGLGFLVDPIVNEQLGATSAGHNSVELEGATSVATVEDVNSHDD